MNDAHRDGARYYLSVGSPNVFVQAVNNSCEFEITDREYRNLIRAKDVLHELSQIEDLFSISANSYADVEKLILTSGIDYLIKGEHSGNIDDFFDNLRDKFNLKILTLLNAFRAYYDQFPQKLHKTEEMVPSLVSEIKEGFSKAFDNCLEYRIMDALRNHSQHASLPLRSVKFIVTNQWKNGEIKLDSPSRARVGFTPYFQSSDLISSEKTNKKTRSDISDLGHTRLDAKIIIRRYVSEFSACHNLLREKSQEQLNEATSLYDHTFERIHKTQKYKITHLEIQKRLDGKIVESDTLLKDAPSRVEQKRKRWNGLKNMARVYVTSEINHGVDCFYGTDPSIWFPK